MWGFENLKMIFNPTEEKKFSNFQIFKFSNFQIRIWLVQSKKVLM